jgi:hypothetical protein
VEPIAGANKVYREQISELKVKHQAAHTKLDELKAGGRDK